jgi:AP-2 complex subunit alpha
MLERNIRNELTATLGQLLTSRDVNLKYLALDTMAKFLSMVGGSFDQHLNHILLALTDEDISIRRRSLDMLFLMASPESAERIVDELISYLESCADFTLKDELVLKIAILAERYARNQVWYIDVVVRLLGTAGEFITDDIWYRIIQLITGFGQYNSDLQHYAAQKLYAVLSLAHVN